MTRPVAPQPPTTPQMEDSRYTSGDYLERNTSYHVEDSEWKALQVVRALEIAGIEPKDVMEVGCGVGEILVQLDRLLGEGEVNFRGYEISPQAHMQSKARERENIQFVLEDLTESEGVSADVLLYMDVVEHVEDCFGFLRKLKPKADLHVVHFPLDMSAQMVARGSRVMAMREKLGHIHYFMRDTAIALLEDCGYEVVADFYTHRPKSKVAKLLSLPRRMLMKFAPHATVRLLGGFSLVVVAR